MSKGKKRTLPAQAGRLAINPLIGTDDRDYTASAIDTYHIATRCIARCRSLRKVPGVTRASLSNPAY